MRHLVVPDGTWRQARRLLRRELLPLGVPCVNLPEGLPSLYSLRRRGEGNLCTLEATAAALACLGEVEVSRGLLQRFARWVSLAAGYHAGQQPSGPSPSVITHPMAKLLPEDLARVE